MSRVNKGSYYFDKELKQFGSDHFSGYDLMFKQDWYKLTLPIEDVNPEYFYIYNNVIISKKGLKYTLIKYYDPTRHALVDLEIILPNGVYKIEPNKFIKGKYQIKKTFDDADSKESEIIAKFEKIYEKYVELLLNHPVLNKDGLGDKCLIGDDIFPFSRVLWQIGDTDRYNLYMDISDRAEIRYYQRGVGACDRISTPSDGVLVESDFLTIDISFVSLSTKDNETIYNKKCVKTLYVRVHE